MKKLNYFAIVAAIAVLFAACNGNGPDDPTNPTGITLSPTMLTIEVGYTATITATFTPEGTTAEITWTSSAPQYATVANGVVTGVAEGSAIITATAGTLSAQIPVTVLGEIPPDFVPVLELGREFFVIYLDGVSRGVIADRIIEDVSPNGTFRNLWLWDQTYAPIDGIGRLNFFGHPDGWMSLEVRNPDWSGKGYHVYHHGDAEWGAAARAQLENMARIMQNPNEWWFHVAVKLGTANDSHMFGFDGDGNTVGRVVIGGVPFIDRYEAFYPHPNAAHVRADGEWHQVMIPMSFLINGVNPGGAPNNNLFLSASVPTPDRNVMFVLSGGGIGRHLQYDAAMIVRMPADFEWTN